MKSCSFCCKFLSQKEKKKLADLVDNCLLIGAFVCYPSKRTQQNTGPSTYVFIPNFLFLRCNIMYACMCADLLYQINLSTTD